MKTIKKWIACFAVVTILCSMSQAQVLAKEVQTGNVIPKITEFKIQGVSGVISEQGQDYKIEVSNLRCDTDLTNLLPEVVCDPKEAVVQFQPLPANTTGDTESGQQTEEQMTILSKEDFSVPRICTVEYQGQKVSYTVQVSKASHAGNPATCTEDSVCTVCGTVLEEKLGHDFLEATCTEPKRCQRAGCNYTEGEALGHDLSEATCTEAAKCQRAGCDYTEGKALGHDLSEATCTEEAKCRRAGCTYTEPALGHDLSEATCTEEAKCQRAGCTYTEPALGHDLSKATCTEAAKCQRAGCDYTEGKPLGHDLSKATCTEAAKCQRAGCDYTEGKPLGHDLSKATCTEEARCQRKGCTYTEPAFGHDLSKATCTEAAKCQRAGCDYTEGKPLEHDLSKATCTEAAKCQREGCDYTEGEALGHRMGKWTVTKESTVTEKGERTRKCEQCDYRETERTERLSRKADARKNQIADLKTDINYPLNETITFHLYGAEQDNTEPIEGDTRYVPESWKIENQFGWRNTDGEAGFQVHKAGFYKVMASFRQQKFENGAWKNTDQTDVKELTIRVGTEAQREEQAKKDAAKKAAKTGDNSQIFVYAFLILAAAGLAGYVVVHNRKKRQ